MFMYQQSWRVVAAQLTFPRESVTCPRQLSFEGWMWEDHKASFCTKDLKPAGVTAQNNNNTLNFYETFHPMIPKHFPLLNPWEADRQNNPRYTDGALLYEPEWCVSSSHTSEEAVHRALHHLCRDSAYFIFQNSKKSQPIFSLGLLNSRVIISTYICVQNLV